MASWSRSTRARICQETVLQPIFMVYNRDTTQDSFGSQAFYSTHRRWEGLGTRLICRLESKVHIFHLCPWVFYLLGGTPLHPAWRMRPPFILQCHLSLQHMFRLPEIWRSLGSWAGWESARRTALRDKPTLQASASCNLSAERTSVLHCDGDSNKASGRIWVRAPPFILGLQRVTKIMHASVTRIAGGVWALWAQQWYS